MTLQLYVLRQILVAFAFALVGIAILVVPSIAIQAIHKLGGATLSAVVRYLPLVVVELVPYLVPIAFLLAVVAAYGRLAADREWTAIRMAGVHPLKLLLPGVLLSVPLTLGTWWLLANVAPEYKYVQRNYLRLAEEETLKSLGHGRTELEMGAFSLKADRVEGRNVFHEVILTMPGERGPGRTLLADRAELSISSRDRTLVVRLEGAQVITPEANPYNESPELRIPIDEISPYRAKERDKPKYRSSSELRADLRAGVVDEERRREVRYEVQRRRALAATYLVFLLLGVPTGLFLRSGTQLAAFSGAVGYAFLYYVLALRLGKELALAGTVPPEAAAWTTNGLFLAAAAVMNRLVLWR